MEGWLGVDVGLRRLHLAVLSRDGTVRLDALAPDRLRRWLAARRRGGRLLGAAVDAPAGWADDAHAADDRVAPKFRRRCAEAVLATREPPHFVSWPSPAEDERDGAAHGWVSIGIDVHETLRAAGVAVDECWPHAAWQRLSGLRRLPTKTSDQGRELRRRLLVAAGLDPAPLRDAGDDHLDAAVAALTAATVDSAERVRASCSDDAHPQRHRGIVLPTRATL